MRDGCNKRPVLPRFAARLPEFVIIPICNRENLRFQIRQEMANSLRWLASFVIIVQAINKRIVNRQYQVTGLVRNTCAPAIERRSKITIVDGWKSNTVSSTGDDN